MTAYALSPIDLIPDFIPVLGLLDDIVLVPAGLWLFVRLLPPGVMDEHRRIAEAAAERPRSRTGVLIVVLVWIAAAAVVMMPVALLPPPATSSCQLSVMPSALATS